MEIKRGVTNLKVDSSLLLPRKQLKKGFMYIFNKGMPGDMYIHMLRLGLAAVAPDLANHKSFGSQKRALINWEKKSTPALEFAPLLRMQKVYGDTPHFRVSIPVMLTNANMLPNNVKQLFITSSDDAPTPDGGLSSDLNDAINTLELRNTFVPGNKVIVDSAWLPSAAKMELAECFFGVRCETKGQALAVFIEVKITKEEAQQLSSTPWLQIRAIDIYPLILHWIRAGFGHKGRPLISSFPVSSIARTLPKDHTKVENLRINEHGLSVTPEGRPAFLQREIDNTARYEDLYLQAGAQDDNSFSLMNRANPSPIKLPANIPVLMDWQNLKFAYSQTTGSLGVMDLSRYNKMTATSAMQIMRVKVDPKMILMFENYAAVCHVSATVKDYVDPDMLASMTPFNANSSMSTYTRTVIADRIKTGDDTFLMRDLSESSEDTKPIARFLTKLWESAMQNLDVLYEKYSVAGTGTYLGWLGTIVFYAKDLDATRLEDNKQRGAALNQKVDPNWEPPAIPLLSKRVGMLPHQKKVRNLLKDSPDLAILPIQAGGGKSPMAIIDVLYEIKAGSNAPYLILCPGHLVPQYVKEIVFFTGGKLNAIPINSYVIRTSGYERLGKIFEAAPRNTVVVCDYDVLRYRQANTIYGTSPTPVYPVIEFLRQFGFQYVLLDESHSVKNASSRTRATMMLIADIPKKRLASGTMAHDSPSDLALQIQMLDPTLFGTRDEFNLRFGEEFAGERVVKWKPMAGSMIMQEIRSRVVVAGAMRKEWAALLPTPEEKILPVTLSPAQKAVYDAVLQETIQIITEEAKKNKALAMFVNGTAPEGESVADEEDRTEGLEGLLKPYLARLEQFMTAPALDPLGDRLLTGEDRISPKVRMIAERIRLHIQSGAPGKVLIFTNYTGGAEEIFNNMPPDLQAMGIHYTAGEKVEKGAEFETADRKKWMVGVEFSMNTGLNMQHVSRLIRVDTVWNPGTLEQGNSRVNRPELKKADRRDRIFYDWIVATGTIDVTKISRLISKIVSVAKFENADDPNYQTLPDVPVIPMTLDNVLNHNSWDDSLMPYMEAYRDFKAVQIDDYAEYRAKHGELKLEPLTVADDPQDAMLLKRVPYVPGLELYSQADLGLVRCDEFLRVNTEDEDAAGDAEAEGDENDNADEADEAGDEAPAVNPQAVALVGQPVHTEWGDGIVVHVSKNLRRIKVRLSTNQEVKLRPAAAFLCTRKETSTRDIRNQVLKAIGQMPISTPIDVPAAIVKDVRITKKELKRLERERKQEQMPTSTKKTKEQPKVLSAELFFNVSNGYLGISYMEDENNADVSQALQAMGFRPTPAFIYAEVNSAQRLVKQFDVWRSAGFSLEPKLAEELSEAFRQMHTLLKQNAIAKNKAVFKYAQASNLANFYRLQHKPNPEPLVFKPYPMVEDGVAYIVLPVRGQAGSKEAIKHKAPGIRWKNSPPNLTFFCPTMEKAMDVLRSVKDAGIQIANVEDLKKQWTKLKRVTFMADGESFM